MNARQGSYRYQQIYRPILKNDELGNDRDAIILFSFEIGYTWDASCMFEQAMAAL